MLSGLSWLALEVKEVPVASEFYAETLSMGALEDADLPASLARAGEQAAFAAGDTALVLRRPNAVPRGGLHTHYAMSIPSEEYDEWWENLEAAGFDLDEHVFGDARSLYLYDPDGNCVELGQQAVDGPGVDGVFEVVLEVAALQRAESFYADLGFETVDEGAGRKRVRMHGPMALELWEPHLGLADARGGVHVDLGFATDDPSEAVDAVADRVTDREELDDAAGSCGAVRVHDPDGHVLTFHAE
ncbi:VOC family protein [Halorubellus sp. JP-L1]|uniref:VOC family protein n=1 Tax=Halorubellus sp. JP-L1 TaxID=2715753 RepID=UPI00140DE33C|nr:VOC family protein [Halorubellus sp. JP-L1]NHN40916.1 VOC family protein [Halorubellus sp. JP-L1]